MENRDLWNALMAKRKGKAEPLHETVGVLSYEVGHMMEYAMRIHWGGEDPALVGFLKSELMDAITQCVILCESLEVPFWQMKEMGMEKAMERFTGKERKD